MNMRPLLILPIVALSACADPDPADDRIRVDCGDTDVIVNREQANALLAGFSGSATDLSMAVCAAFADIDASADTEPRDVTVLTPNGAQVQAQVQASQQ